MTDPNETNQSNVDSGDLTELPTSESSILESPISDSPADASAPPPDRRLQRVLLVLIVLACAGVTSLMVLNVIEKKRADPGKDLQGKSLTPSLFDQPLEMVPFTLLDQDGNPFGSEQLKDKVFVANFFFSTCPTICPRMLGHTRNLQIELKKRLGPRAEFVELVSISVDPEKDTPAKLRETAENWDADPNMWHFLTGTREEVWEVVDKSFRTGVTANPKNKAEPIIHSPNYVLVDSLGRIRGYYDGLNPEKRSELLRDLLRLMSSGE